LLHSIESEEIGWQRGIAERNTLQGQALTVDRIAVAGRSCSPRALPIISGVETGADSR